MEKKKKNASKHASAKMHLSYISMLVIVENKKSPRKDMYRNTIIFILYSGATD